MSKTVSLAVAKAHLSECVRDVEFGEAILITRHGRPVAALVHADELEQLERLRKSGPKTGLASIAGGRIPDLRIQSILADSRADS